MPANLSIEAQQKWSEYLDAKSLDDRIFRLEAFIGSINKHKGNERLIAQNKANLAKLKAERDAVIQRQKTVSAAKEDIFAIKREPHTTQVVMLSDFFENDRGAGKTTLLRNLTGVKEGTPGIFTAEPIKGIYDWENIKFQLIEEPAIHVTQYLPKVLGLVRVTDILLLIVDLSRDPLLQMENMLKILDENNIFVNRKKPSIVIERTGVGGVKIFFLTIKARESEGLTEFIRETVKQIGLANVNIKVYDKITEDEVYMAIQGSSVFIPAMIIATKADLLGSKQNYAILCKKYGLTEDSSEQIQIDPKNPVFKVLPVAITQDENGTEIRKGLDDLAEKILKTLNCIRVFTRSKSHLAARPLILPIGSTIADVALQIHKDLYNAFKYAIVSRKEGPLRKIRAGLQFEVQDFDIVEISSTL